MWINLQTPHQCDGVNHRAGNLGLDWCNEKNEGGCAVDMLRRDSPRFRPDSGSGKNEQRSHAPFSGLVRIDSSDPPGNETKVAEYVKKVLEAEGIPVTLAAKDPARANVIARLKGNGSKRPLLIMGHSDTVRVDAAKWTFPPFSANRQGGYVYGRGTLDDKSDLLAALMTMLLLKRSHAA